MADRGVGMVGETGTAYVARPGLVWHTTDNYVPDSEPLGQALGTGVLRLPAARQ